MYQFNNRKKISFYEFEACLSAPSALSYLSDRTPTSSTNGWGPFERNKSNGEQAAGDGNRLTINGVTYSKGLGVHAGSEIVYDLSGKYDVFSASVGVDDEAGNNGTVKFQVFADGVKVYDSGLMTGQLSAKLVNVDVHGKNQLKLVVTDGGDGNAWDHADWGNARVFMKGRELPDAGLPPIIFATKSKPNWAPILGDVFVLAPRK
jgi:hypothetical protein